MASAVHSPYDRDRDPETKPVARVDTTADGKNPALPIISSIPLFPWFGVLKVMQHLYHQQYLSSSKAVMLDHSYAAAVLGYQMHVCISKVLGTRNHRHGSTFTI